MEDQHHRRGKLMANKMEKVETSLGMPETLTPNKQKKFGGNRFLNPVESCRLQTQTQTTSHELIMAKDDAQQHLPKRQRLLGGNTDERRAAFEEDMAQIRSALVTGEGEDISMAATNTGTSNGAPPVDANGDEITEEAHEPSSTSSFNVTSEVVEGSEKASDHQRGLGDDEHVEQRNDDDGGNWLKNYTPHHTRIGTNYQVTDLPTVPSCRPANINSSISTAVSSVTSCVSPGD